MKTFIAFLVLLVGFAPTPVSAEQQTFSETNCIPKTTLYYNNGAIRKCKLKEPVTIQGYPCQRWIRFYENGVLEQFELTETLAIQGIDVPEKSTVFLYRDGHLQKCWFSKTLTLQEVPCKGGRIGKVSTTFHKNGKLRRCFLPETTIIQGIPCKASLLDHVGFDPNGKLESCTLADTITLNGNVYKRGMKLRFNEQGEVL